MSAIAVEEPLHLEIGPSEAHAVEYDHPLAPPPVWQANRLAQTIKLGLRPLEYGPWINRTFGDVAQVKILMMPEALTITTHPDHARALFQAGDEAPSLTGESPLRPILGPTSVLTSNGPVHMRQRKLLLPAFHGEAIERYVQMITDVTEREIDRWEVGQKFPLASRMQAVTLDVIASGIFGIDGVPPRGSTARKVRDISRRMMLASANPAWRLVDLHNMRREEPRGVLRAMMSTVDRHVYKLIAERRAQGVDPQATDVLSMMMGAHDEDGQPLNDQELRDQLVTLVVAGHETTANSLAWTFERMLHTPGAYEELRGAVAAGGEEGTAFVDASVAEGMRMRPVITMVLRLIKRPWKLGEYVVPAGTPVGININGIHHREDIYPDPHSYRPQRFLQRKPGTYTWLPFGGGIHRCLGATLAMAEQRVVMDAVARRVELEIVDPKPERALQRNVTMIPRHGTRVIVRAKR